MGPAVGIGGGERALTGQHRRICRYAGWPHSHVTAKLSAGGYHPVAEPCVRPESHTHVGDDRGDDTGPALSALAFLASTRVRLYALRRRGSSNRAASNVGAFVDAHPQPVSVGFSAPVASPLLDAGACAVSAPSDVGTRPVVELLRRRAIRPGGDHVEALVRDVAAEAHARRAGVAAVDRPRRRCGRRSIRRGRSPRAKGPRPHRPPEMGRRSSSASRPRGHGVGSSGRRLTGAHTGRPRDADHFFFCFFLPLAAGTQPAVNRRTSCPAIANA